jgi:hypothetical protein
MPSKIEDVLFSEPSGRWSATVMFAGSLLFLSSYVYFGVLGDSSTVHELFFAVGLALSGIAESLPAERRRTAGGFRIAAMLVFVTLLGLLAFAPEFIIGTQ